MDLSKFVFDTANALNEVYLEGIKQGQKLPKPVEKPKPKEKE